MWDHPKQVMNEGHVLMIPCVFQFSRFVWATALIVMEKEAYLYIYAQLFQYIYIYIQCSSKKKENKERKKASETKGRVHGVSRVL
jgi:hypothetical protein